MRKIIAVILWAWIPFLGYPLWGQSPGVGEGKTSQKIERKGNPTTKDPNAEERGTQKVPFFVEIKEHPKSVAEATEDKRKSDEKDRNDSWTLRFTGLTALLTFALVLVGAGAVCAAIRTLRGIDDQGRRMKEQAELMARQADLMQAQFDQWVDLENWKVNKEPDKLAVWVDLVNHTGYPITLEEGYLMITENGGERYIRVRLGERSFLSPNQPYPIELDLGTIMHPEELMSLPSASFKIKGIFSHSHRITKKEVSQPFEGLLWCGPLEVDHKWHITYTPFVHMNPAPPNDGTPESGKKANLDTAEQQAN